MDSEPFKPEGFGFVHRSDYQPPLDFPDYYERDSPDHRITADDDWGRINVFIAKDLDFVRIWYGALDPVSANILSQKWHGFDWTDTGHYPELFLGYISTKQEAEVILNALRLDRFRIELNLGMLP